MTRSILTSLALSAATLGTFTVVSIDRGTPGATAFVDSGAAADFSDPALLSRFTDAVASRSGAVAPPVLLLAPTPDAADPKALLARVDCPRRRIASVNTSLHPVPGGLDLRLEVRLEEPSPNPEIGRVRLAYLIVRSPPFAARVPADPNAIPAALNHFVSEQHTALLNQLETLMADTADLLASALAADPDNEPTGPTLGKSALQVICPDCTKADVVLHVTDNRVWLRPKSELKTVWSVPRKPLPTHPRS